MNATGGYLDNGIKYYNQTLKTRQPVKKDDINFDEISDAIDDIGLEQVSLPNKATALKDIDSQAQEDCQILKGLVVNSQNLDEIKLKLTKTIQYRSRIVKDQNLDLRVEFPYFFTHPSLVSSIASLKTFISK